MKENFIHVCFVIDESGSMGSSVSDVLGGFKKVIDEQKAVKDGTCAVSLYKFATTAKEVYKGKNVNEAEYLTKATYNPNGLTAMNDGIGMAIDEIGKWLNGMKEEERPEKNLFIIMTDGEENNSRDYSLTKVQEMIKHQEEKYNWSFVYMGTNITDLKSAKDLGINLNYLNTRTNIDESYDFVSKSISRYRTTAGDPIYKNAFMCNFMVSEASAANNKYEAETGIKIKNKD